MKRFTVLLLVFGALVLALPLAAQSRFTFNPTTPPLATAPLHGTFYSMQRQGIPPMPFNRFPELPVYEVAPGVYLVDDRSVDYDAQNAAMNLLQSVLSGGNEPLNGTEENDPPPAYDHGPGVLWLEITQSDTRVTNLLHGTEAGKTYELFSKASLTDAYWLPVELKTAPDELTPYSALPKLSPTNRFFRAQQGDIVVRVQANQDAAEPGTSAPAVTGWFDIYAEGATNDTLVRFRLTGTAANGVDYTNLASSVLVPASAGVTTLFIEPVADSLVEFDETVTLTINDDPAYLIDPGEAAATVTIADNVFEVVTELNHAVGLDYHPGIKALVASINYPQGEPFNFVRIYTNGVSTNLFVTNWSGIHGLDDEVKLAIVKEDNAGFHTGDMFFGTGVNGVIGKLSADGSVSNLNWAVLTDNTNGTDTLLRGSLYVDQSGSFGGDLIVVTGNSEFEGGGVWRVNANARLTHLASITNNPYPHLEGVVALTNDVPAWGPWAGRIVTGAESAYPKPLMYSVANDGTNTEYAMGIAPEDFDLVPPDQDLYCAIQYDNQPSKILKISRSRLAAYVGWLLVTQSGDGAGQHGARLFFVRWNHGEKRFETKVVTSLSGGFEHVTFAPVILPSH